jgi:hypothetical protein
MISRKLKAIMYSLKIPMITKFVKILKITWYALVCDLNKYMIAMAKRLHWPSNYRNMINASLGNHIVLYR